MAPQCAEKIKRRMGFKGQRAKGYLKQKKKKGKKGKKCSNPNAKDPLNFNHLLKVFCFFEAIDSTI